MSHTTGEIIPCVTRNFGLEGPFKVINMAGKKTVVSCNMNCMRFVP